MLRFRDAPFLPVAGDELQGLLNQFRTARVAVLGDFCLDIYWMIDLARSEQSLETGLHTHPIRQQRYSLGGAGNVANNLASLGCTSLYALGVIGDDPWGKELVRLLDSIGADTGDMLVQGDEWSTLAYGKPHIEDQEGNRLDFGNYNQLSAESGEELLARARNRIDEVDVLIINQQVREGIHSPRFREGLLALTREKHGCIFIVDSRHYSEFFEGSLLKINDHEATRLCGKDSAPEDLVLREDACEAAETLFQRSQEPVFVTRGSRGLIVRDEHGLAETPGLQVPGKVDTVGAGDSVLAGISLGLAIGCRPAVAAQLGNLAAAVTIRKLRVTGTASPAEVLAIGADRDYVLRPELAEDPRRARYLEGTEIEVITPWRDGVQPLHAIFDHDGTLSTLREGWEEVMEPMMIHAILGARYEDADEAVYQRVVARVRELIDRTTGIQTLVQMEGLVRIVEEFGLVRVHEIHDARGYKRDYNDALMEKVRHRSGKLGKGQLTPEDFSIKNAIPFLHRLRKAGVHLYLASGTDEDDVREEAQAMGYADLFDRGIYGSIGDPEHDAKRVVLDRILADVGSDASGRLVVFGDGPVEIRETCKRGGRAVGIASDEIRRFGLNAAKRTRLIKAGAHLIIPDYSEMEQLLGVLGFENTI
jgi:rfaE bifunctional protein kinase chain/domain